MTEPTVVSLFSGAGGLDYGFEAAGFVVRAAVEMDRDCCKTLRASRSFPVIEEDIHKVTSATILSVAGLKPRETGVVIGGPPCQPFSKSAYWSKGDTRRLDDPRADTLHAFMRVVRDLQPRVFLFENVHGISYSGKEEGFHLLHDLVQQINRETGCSYCFSWKVINTADYGVPQTRKRFILIAHREGADFTFPPTTHTPRATDRHLFDESVADYVTAWEAIGHLEPDEDEDLRLRGKWANLLPSIPEGENYLWHTSRKGGLPLFGWRTRYWSFLLKLAKDRPSWTIQAQPGPAIGPFHWGNRRLSVKEMLALQTFPTSVIIHGSRVSVQRQIGNAVPSLVAEVLAGEIRSQFFGDQMERPPVLAVERKDFIPPAEPVMPVPKEYLHLRGNHSDHPGEGRGHRARYWGSGSTEGQEAQLPLGPEGASRS